MVRIFLRVVLTRFYSDWCDASTDMGGMAGPRGFEPRIPGFRRERSEGLHESGASLCLNPGSTTGPLLQLVMLNVG